MGTARTWYLLAQAEDAPPAFGVVKEVVEELVDAGTTTGIIDLLSHRPWPGHIDAALRRLHEEAVKQGYGADKSVTGLEVDLTDPELLDAFVAVVPYTIGAEMFLSDELVFGADTGYVYFAVTGPQRQRLSEKLRRRSAQWDEIITHIPQRPHGRDTVHNMIRRFR